MALFRCRICGCRVKIANSVCSACKSHKKFKPSDELGVQDYDIKNRFICKICGIACKSLGGHLRSEHNMSSSEYIEKFKLPKDMITVQEDNYIASKQKFKRLSPMEKIKFRSERREGMLKRYGWDKNKIKK
jgi:predicted transcriptional regulator